MWKILLNADLRNLPKILFLLFLSSYPFFAYIVSAPDQSTAQKMLGLICLSFLFYRIFEIYKTQSNLVIPFYVLLFGLYTGYTLLCSLFISDYFAERGIKYFYSDKIWLSFIALIIVENTQFSYNSLSLVKKVLVVTLILASVASIIQISNPLFFVNNEALIQGISYNRMAEYYENAPINISEKDMGKVSRLFSGYRLSIFSWINQLSVGIDTIAIFSILVAWRPINLIDRGVVTVSAAIVSFLSSSRWIILGFFVVASQIFWTSRNKLINLLYFVFYSVVMLTAFGLVANIMGFDVEQYISERLMDDSASTRLLAFEVFFEVFPDNPIFGTGGVDTEEMVNLLAGRSSQIHVGFLKLFYYYGLIGGLLYLSFMVAFLIRLRKMAKYSGYWGGFFAILAFFIANLTLFELSLFYYGPLLAIIFANYFYFNKMEDKTTLIMNGKLGYRNSN